MSDFQIQVGGDFNELLRGFQQLEARAQQAGVNVGKGIGEGIQGYSSKSLAALQAELSRLQQRQVKVAVDSTAFDKTGEKIRRVEALIEEVQRRRLALTVDDRSITSLQNKLAQLQTRQVKLDVDSAEFADAQRQINALEQELNDVSRRKLLIDADPSSVLALRAKLSDLQGQLERVAIGSDRFEELSDAIRQTERELAKAGESADQFRILDGVVQGIAFSLSNALVNGAQQALAALGNVVGEFGRLDTELRKAAAASGEAGAYEALAASVDRVGIEAAGTTLEVAELNTELIRGGMTVEQANASLAAIVRGAEATGTSFANMGSVVSASLKSFGLEASDAQRVVDALVTGANASAASAEGMGMAFKYAAPVAKLLGVSIEDLALTTGLLTNAGIDASEAGVTLRNGLSKLASAAPKAGGAMDDLHGQAAIAAKSMRSLGVDIYNANGTLKPMEQTLLQLKGAFEKLDPASKIRLASNLFGGEDDGAKWLALLNQSEEEIRRMAQTLANTKGATDVARDAMTGFELKLKQLDGTLGSLGITFGSVAAAALVPFIDAANTIVGAITALPGPVKALGAGLTLLAGGYVVATAAQIAFTRALQAEAVQSAISGVAALGTALRARLAGAATVAIVAVDALVKAVSTLTFAKVAAGVDVFVTAMRAKLAGAATVAIVALDKLKGAIASGAIWTAIKGFGAALGGVAVSAGVLASVVAPVAAALAVFTAAFQGAAEASDRYKTTSKEVEDAITKLGKALEGTADKASSSRSILVAVFQDIQRGFAVLNDQAYAKKLDQQFTSLTSSAQQFYDTLQSSGEVTAQQAQQATAFAAALQSSSSAAQDLAQKYEALAIAAERDGAKEAAEKWRALAAQFREAAGTSSELSARLMAKAAITAQDIVNTGKATEVTKAQADAERELAQVIAEQPVRTADARLAVGQQLLSLAQALSEQEQNQFAITKANLEYQLSQAERRKASEGSIKQIKDEINRIDIAALQARYAGLQQEQSLQRELLRLSQEKARLEADLAVSQQSTVVLETAKKLQEAINSGKQTEINAAKAALDLQTQVLAKRYEQVGLLERTQPLETQVLNAQQQTAEGAIRAALAQKGFTGELQASAGYAGQAAAATGDIAGQANRYANEARRAAEQQVGIANAAEQTRTETTQAANSAGTLATNTGDGARRAGDLANAAGKAQGNLDNSAKAAGGVTDQLGKAGTAADTTATKAGQVGASAVNSANQSKALIDALGTAAGSANAIATAQMATNISRASGSAGGIASAMVTASNAAKTFYDWLAAASGLPGSRWTGGPVDAGQTVRINDGPAGRSLGQEAFLSAAGKLSLINRPANSLWTAPTSGTVIPAGITKGLKDRGVFDSGRAARAAVASAPAARIGAERDLAATVARQAVAIGKLQQSVDRLVDKSWDVHLQVRSDGSGARYLNLLNGMG